MDRKPAFPTKGKAQFPLSEGNEEAAADIKPAGVGVAQENERTKRIKELTQN